MKKRKIIGSVLLVTAVGIATCSVLANLESKRSFRDAQADVLFRVRGSSVGDAGSFAVTYRFAHGYTIINGEYLKANDEEADIEVAHNNSISRYRYKEGASSVNGGIVLGSNLVVKVSNTYDGDILFKNSVCGCERGPLQIAVIVFGILALLIFILGMLLIRNNPTPAPTQGDE